MDDSLALLIIDDDEVDRMAVHRVLDKTELTFSLAEATSAEVALELTLDQFDCILLDYRLPDQDGLALVKRLRDTGSKVPLIVLTGHGDEQIAVELMKAGASDYLSKSKLSPEILQHMVRNAILVYRADQLVHRADQRVALANQRLRENNELLKRQNRELEQQRQQIQRQNLQLIEVSRLKTEFLATMSHELRTPLNAIIGFSQILMRQTKGQLSDYQQNMVGRILMNGKNLLALINDVLDLSKIEAGRLDLKLEEFNLEQLIVTTVKELRTLADQKKLTLEVKIRLQDPTVLNDARRLRQVLTNLLSNAIKFTDRGSIYIKAEDISPDQIVIWVEDTGVGIAPEHLSAIFDAFHQADQTVTRRHGGTGLGLSITDLLLKMMQGTIRVSSKVNQGTTFRVELPRRVTFDPNPVEGEGLASPAEPVRPAVI